MLNALLRYNKVHFAHASFAILIKVLSRQSTAQLVIPRLRATSSVSEIYQLGRVKVSRQNMILMAVAMSSFLIPVGNISAYSWSIQSNLQFVRTLQGNRDIH